MSKLSKAIFASVAVPRSKARSRAVVFQDHPLRRRTARRLDTVDWPERVKTMQRNWIGRSEGARLTFRTETGEPLEVFTTRPDTVWGATFMVLAPEHPAGRRS